LELFASASPGLSSLSTIKAPAGIVDHFAIGVPRFSKEPAVRNLKQRNGSPEDDPYAGLHIKDPDGINLQIFS
jgi:hypothetical protein